MGRFKIYDPAKLVSIVNKSNYGNCLLCERRLKVVAGNIIRHYQQMHSQCVKKSMKTKKSEIRCTKSGEKDNCKIENVTKKSGNKKAQNHKTNYKNINPETPANPPEIIMDINNSSKHLIGNDHHTAIAQTDLVQLNGFVPSTIYQETKWHEYEEHVMLPLQTKMTEEERPTKCSNIVKIKRDDKNDVIKIPCYSYINNIQIDAVDADHQLDFLKCLVETKTIVNIPLKIFKKGDTFQKALQSDKQNFQFDYSTEAIGENIDRMTKKLRQEITKMVNNRIIYLKLDIASSQEGNIMFVNIQFINDFEMKVITLSALELSDDDLVTYLKKKVITILERFKIDIGRVSSIIKDNTNNIRVVSEQMVDERMFLQPIDYCHNLCHNFPGHAIHFVANDTIKLLHENISQSRDSAISIRQQFARLNLTPMPLLSNTISWFSVYDMIESLLTTRQIVESNEAFVAEVDWLFATKFVDSFRPIVDTALMLQSSHLFTMGDFYREWLLCEVKLKELTASNEIALYLEDALCKQKVNFFKNELFLAALYMDPRFCYMGSMHMGDKQKEIAINQLLAIFNKLKILNEETTSPISKKHTNNDLSDRYSKLTANLKGNMEMMTYDTVSLREVDFHWLKERLEHFQFEEKLPLNISILEYWQAAMYKSPILAKIAEVALAAPATQATLDRAVNMSSINLIRRKHIASTHNTEDLLLLKLNNDLVNKITLQSQ